MLFALINVVFTISGALSVFYILSAIKMLIIKPHNRYDLPEDKYVHWYKEQIVVHFLLAVVFLLLFLSLLHNLPGYIHVVLLFFLLVIYVFRIRNNLKYL